MARAGVRRQYEQRQGIVQEALNSTLENDRAVEAVLTSNGQRQVGRDGLEVGAYALTDTEFLAGYFAGYLARCLKDIFLKIP